LCLLSHRQDQLPSRGAERERKEKERIIKEARARKAIIKEARARKAIIKEARARMELEKAKEEEEEEGKPRGAIRAARKEVQAIKMVVETTTTEARAMHPRVKALPLHRLLRCSYAKATPRVKALPLRLHQVLPLHLPRCAKATPRVKALPLHLRQVLPLHLPQCSRATPRVRALP
jgi:hypothetical protein